ncbi:MAG: M48 family metallopeptidase [Burkholderiales bacterium]|nr:M48 family metallopeptidase [Burkholderiales bacterium]
MHANYFDGKQGQALAVTVHLEADGIRLEAENQDSTSLTFKTVQLRIGELFQRAPMFVYMNDGSHCEVQDAETKNALQQHLNYQPSVVERWQSHWWLALLAVFILLAALYGAYVKGAPFLAEKMVPLIPDKADVMLGNLAMDALDQTYFKPSRLIDVLSDEVQSVLSRVSPEHPRLPFKLHMRHSKTIGANAFALPSGDVVVTDDMYVLMLNPDRQLDEHGKKLLAAVLAHEIAHVELRHTMRNLAETSLMTVVVNSLIGDFSTVLTTASGTVLNAKYSREKEAEADRYAIALLKEKGVSPIYFALALERLQRSHGVKKTDEDVGWFSEATLDYLSSHPNIQERIQSARAAAKDFKEEPGLK